MQFIIALCNSRIFTGHFTESKTNCDSQLKSRLVRRSALSLRLNIKCLYLNFVSQMCSFTYTSTHAHPANLLPENMRQNKMLGIHLQLTCPFVMLIGQITQHHSKLNGWLITLKLQASCFLDVSEASADVSIFFFLGSDFDWQARV